MTVEPLLEPLPGELDRAIEDNWYGASRSATTSVRSWPPWTASPAAGAVLLEWAGIAGLYDVGTVPAFRGRGLATFVSLAALVAGRADGYRYGVLQASTMGEPLYRSIGFETRSRFTFAVRGG